MFVFCILLDKQQNMTVIVASWECIGFNVAPPSTTGPALDKTNLKLLLL